MIYLSCISLPDILLQGSQGAYVEANVMSRSNDTLINVN